MKFNKPIKFVLSFIIGLVVSLVLGTIVSYAVAPTAESQDQISDAFERTVVFGTLVITALVYFFIGKKTGK